MVARVVPNALGASAFTSAFPRRRDRSTFTMQELAQRSTLRLQRLEERLKLRVLLQYLEIGILLHPVEVGVSKFHCLPKFAQCVAFPFRQGQAAGEIVMRGGVLRLQLDELA